MMFIFTTFLVGFFLFLSTNEVGAILVVIPTVLVPIVNIVVWIIGAILTPVIGLSALYFKIKRKNLFLGIVVGISILVLIALVTIFIFKLIDPQRPIY